MDSYEKIRKMGEISKELKKHGLAKDSSEALKKAESIMSPRDREFYVSQERLSSLEEKKETETDAARTNDNQIRKLASEFNDRLTSVDSDISLIRNKMNEIIAKINEIESKISSQARHEFQATLSTENKRQENKDESKDRGIKPEIKKEYNSSDVSIEKMFYSGNR
jgi:predicted  nucleic acid-binding Zn-ribbon protein